MVIWDAEFVEPQLQIEMAELIITIENEMKNDLPESISDHEHLALFLQSVPENSQ